MPWSGQVYSYMAPCHNALIENHPEMYRTAIQTPTFIQFIQTHTFEIEYQMSILLTSKIFLFKILLSIQQGMGKQQGGSKPKISKQFCGNCMVA